MVMGDGVFLQANHKLQKYRLAKKCLKTQVDAYELLSYTDLETASLVNRRPHMVREYDDDEGFPVSPSDLLLGRMAGYQGTKLGPEAVAFSDRVLKIEQFVQAWWARWQSCAFPLFTPRRKWVYRARNLTPGDVVLLLEESKLKRGSYRLAIVREVKVDEAGVVRSAVIALRDRRRGAGTDSRELIMAVQRLALILPVEERCFERGGLSLLSTVNVNKIVGG